VPDSLVLDFDIYKQPGLETHFHDTWKSLQAEGVPDIVWTPRNEGHWLVTNGRLVSQVFEDYEKFSSRVLIVPKSSGEHHTLLPTTLDPPKQRPYRSLLVNSLSPRAVARTEKAIRSLAIEAIEGFRANGGCEFMEDYASKLPIRVFLSLVDLPFEDSAQIKYWADQTSRPDGSISFEDCITSLRNYVMPYILERREKPGSDLISSIVNGTVNGQPIDVYEASQICVQILIGGTDTVVNLMGFIMEFLARSAPHREYLVAHPERVADAVEELIRRFPTVADSREVAQDLEFEGVTMKKGDMIVMPTIIHGIDDRENPNAMEVDFSRETYKHSTFGNGAHKCPGAHLARTEIRITLEEWLKRIPNFGIAPGAEVSYTGGVVGSVNALELAWV